MSKRKTTKEFIEYSILKHGNKYDYSKVKYINAKTKVKIICPKHGEFKQLPRYHEKGQKCIKCSGLYMDTKLFIYKAKKIHRNKYDYSKVKYFNNRIKIKIICPEHNNFEQKPKDHLLGKGCPKCVGIGKNTNDFILESDIIHENKYNYSKIQYVNAKTKVKIICPKHGEFKQTPNSHLQGKGCPICKESKGEKKIRLFLNKNNIKYKIQFKFIDCKNIRALPFDFYLPNKNMCIEFQGEQHYKPFKYFGGNKKYLKTRKNDLIKYDYCLANDIKLIIIKYSDDINKILRFLE
jgi:hypothetical protein